MKKDGEKDFGQIHLMKSHFADEERLRGTYQTKRDFEEKNFGQKHIYEVSLRGRRETSGNLSDEKRLRRKFL
jgi:hypothetical protein